MFSKNKSQEAETISVQQLNSAGNASSGSNQAPKRGGGGGKMAPSIFSNDLVVEGTLNSDGDIQVDGRIEGNINSGSVTIGEKAVINGEIRAKEVTIRGRVIGSIRAYKVALSSTSHVEGDILHNALAVESGAFFDGNCRHADDPLSAELPGKGRASKNETGSQPSGPLKSKPAQKTNGVGGTTPSPTSNNLRNSLRSTSTIS